MNAYDIPLKRRLLGSILRRQAEAEGDRIYMRFAGRAFSFAETDRTVRALARGLARRGVRRHDRVVLLLPNGSDFVLAWYAVCVLGAAMVPVNPSYKGLLLTRALADADCRGLIVHRDLLPHLATADADVLARLEWAAVAGGLDGANPPSGPGHYLPFEELKEENGADPEPDCDFRDIHSIMYTSGTTGPSKGVMIPNAHFFSSASTFLRALRLTRDDVLFTNLPLFHGLASRLGALPALMVGAELVIGERFSATSFWKDVCEANASVAHTIFTIPPILKARPPGPYDRAHRLRAMYNAHHDAEFEERFGVRLVEAYGQTETGLVVYTPYPERWPGAAGRVHEDWEIRIVDDLDLPVSPGEHGEIVLRPKLPHIMMREYLNQPEATLDAWRNLWFHTGDIARMDEDGYVYFLDRSKERIRRRGENISSWEIELHVSAHPAVSECAALAHPAEAGEDDIRVVITLKEGASLRPEVLMDWLQERMPHFMLPRYVEFVDEIPRSPSNKVEKHRLVAEGLGPDAWDRQASHAPRRPQSGTVRQRA